MTAINVFLDKSKGVAHLVTDGAGVDYETGAYTGPTQKVALAPHINAAVAFRGAAELGMNLTRRVSCADGPTFDQMRELLVPELRQIHQAYAPHLESIRKGHSHFDLVVTGISETRGPCGFIVSSHSAHGMPAWAIQDIELALMTPASPELEQAFVDEIQMGNYPPADLASRVVSHQRRIHSRILSSDAFPRVIVGGFVQLVSVSIGGISTKMVKRWPDVIGRALAS